MAKVFVVQNDYQATVKAFEVQHDHQADPRSPSRQLGCDSCISS
jgi:hypothetical protein